MGKRRAFFVIGWEGSGTHMMTDALRAAGCHEEPFHGGYHPNYRFYEMPDLFVFRRSLPHAHQWPKLKDMTKRMERAGYVVQPVMMLRDWNATIKSVIRRGYHLNSVKIENQMRQALIAASLGFKENLLVVTYEAFCLSEGFRRWLFDRLDLPYPADFQIHYANEQYYE